MPASWTIQSTPIVLLVFFVGLLSGAASLVLAERWGGADHHGAWPWRTWMARLWMWNLSIGTGILFCLTWLASHAWTDRILWDVFWLVLVVVTSTDLGSMRVPNRISLPAAVVFLGYAGLAHRPWVTGLMGAIACSGLLYLIHLLTGGRGMGMGDVKLYVSIGAMLGPVQGLESLISASAFASVCGGLLLLLGKMTRRQPFPFVPYILSGVIFATFFGPTVNAWYANLVWS